MTQNRGGAKKRSRKGKRGSKEFEKRMANLRYDLGWFALALALGLPVLIASLYLAN